MIKPKVPLVDGVRIANRHELGNYETPLYKEATSGRNVICYYEGDDIPEYLTAPQPAE